MRLRKLNNILHRDLGYFIAGTTVIYALSGLAVNHLGDWNPNFIIERRPVQTPAANNRSEITKDWVMDVLEPLGQASGYRSHDFPSAKKLKIYLDDGSVFVNLQTGEGELETVTRRPLFYQINRLHLSPRRAWLAFSDVFAVILIIVSITGLFVLRGKTGITGRGAVLAIVGVLIPVAFMFLI